MASPLHTRQYPLMDEPQSSASPPVPVPTSSSSPPASSSGTRVLLGTCSWTDPTLVACGRFYPDARSSSKVLVGLRSPSSSSSSSPSSSPSAGEKRLWFYSRRLACVEVDASNYAIPAPHLCEAWCSAVPTGFTFNVKAFCLFTAKQIPTAASLPASVRSKLSPEVQQKTPLTLDDLSPAIRTELWECLNSSLAVFHRAAKLGAVLFQFPLGFSDTPQNRDYVLSCRRMLHRDFEMAVEFRCASWLAQTSGDDVSLLPAANCTPGSILPSYVKEDVMDWLQRNAMVFVIVDEFIEEWSDPSDDSSTKHNRSTTPKGAVPTFVSSHALLSSSSSSSPKSNHASSSSSSSVAALGFQLSSRLLSQEPALRQSTPITGHSSNNSDETFVHQPQQSLQRRRQLFGEKTQESKHIEGVVERKVRMVPIVERVTSRRTCYVRIHRRRGTDKLLRPNELAEWALRIHQGTIYVMMNTNYEDQGIQNTDQLAQRLSDLVPDWKKVQEDEAERAKRSFMSLLYAGAKKEKLDRTEETGSTTVTDGQTRAEAAGLPSVAEEKESGVEDKEPDLMIVGHGKRTKEQTTLDDLLTTNKKRKRRESAGGEAPQTSANGTAKKTLRQKKATKKDHTASGPGLRKHGQTSLFASYFRPS